MFEKFDYLILLKLFKLKLLAFKPHAILAPITKEQPLSILIDNSCLFSTSIRLSVCNTTKSQGAINKLLFFYCSLVEKALFQQHTSLAKVSTSKYHFADFTRRHPAFTEFKHRFIKTTFNPSRFAKVKAPVNFYVNKVNFGTHVYANFFREFAFKPFNKYRKNTKIILLKTLAAHFAFNTYNFSKNEINYQFSLFILRYFYFTSYYLPLFSKKPFSLLSLFRIYFSTNFFPVSSMFWFASYTGLYPKEGQTGMVAFIKRRSRLTKAVVRKPLYPIRHLGFFYPFKLKSSGFLGSPRSLLFRKKEDLTVFDFNVMRMLKRKFTFINMFKPEFNSRVDSLKNNILINELKSQFFDSTFQKTPGDFFSDFFKQK